MEQIDDVIAKLNAMIEDQKQRRDPQNDTLVYLLEVALAEARDVKAGVRRQLPEQK